MPIYEYKGLNNRGKNVAGVLDADSPRSLKERLLKEGIFISEYIESRGGAETRRAGQQQAGSREVKFGAMFQRVKLLELSEVTRQLSTLVRSGIPIVEAVGAVAEQLENPLLKKVLSEVKRSVSEGSTLAQAMRKHPKVFSDMYVNMVGSGETSGTLDVVFERLASVTESQVRLRSKLTSALMYPAIMVFLGFGIVLLMMVFVIPQMRDLFDRMGADLPFLTRSLIWASDLVAGGWFFFILFFIAFGIWFSRWKKSENGRPVWDAATLKMPIFGKLLKEMAVARFARTLGTLMNAGVPILNALGIVQSVVGNHVFATVVDAARDAVKEGKPIGDALRRSGHFPPMVCHMISVGEKSGQIEDMLGNVADSYELQIEQKVTRLTAVLEPVMIVIMGLVVGLMVFAIIMPMLEINQHAAGR
jgi:general secretion pathway protein F